MGLRFRVQSSRLEIPDSRFEIPDSRFKIPDSRFKIPDSRFQIPDSKSETLLLLSTNNHQPLTFSPNNEQRATSNEQPSTHHYVFTPRSNPNAQDYAKL